MKWQDMKEMELKGNEIKYIPKTASQIWTALLAPAFLSHFQEGAYFISYSFTSPHFSL